MAQVWSPYSSVPNDEWSWERCSGREQDGRESGSRRGSCGRGLTQCRQQLHAWRYSTTKRHLEEVVPHLVHHHHGGALQKKWRTGEQLAKDWRMGERIAGECQAAGGAAAPGAQRSGGRAAGMSQSRATHPRAALDPGAALKAAVAAGVGKARPAAEAGWDQVHPAKQDGGLHLSSRGWTRWT